MNKFRYTFLCLFLLFEAAYSQGQFTLESFQWALFKNTPNWQLAKAVADEDTGTIFSLAKAGKINIDLKEPKFGKTLLFLAVDNDKLNSVYALLKAGANVNARDFRDNQPIHEAVDYIRLKTHTPEIIKLLTQYGADVNSFSKSGAYKVPLEAATVDFKCAKLLFEKGANIYFKQEGNFLVWSFMLMTDETDRIYFAKYLIIEKKVKIPGTILFTFPDKKPLDIYALIKKSRFSRDPEKVAAADEIVAYLHKINFPSSGVYK